jgi:hypothetical protein
VKTSQSYVARIEGGEGRQFDAYIDTYVERDMRQLVNVVDF